MKIPDSSTSIDAEDAHERDRERARCVGWWEQQVFLDAMCSSLYHDMELVNGVGLDTQCWMQRYEMGMESAIQVALDFVEPGVSGRELIDRRHRFQRRYPPKRSCECIGYQLRGFTKMYIVHLSDNGKADTGTEGFQKDPERKECRKNGDEFIVVGAWIDEVARWLECGLWQ